MSNNSIKSLPEEKAKKSFPLKLNFKKVQCYFFKFLRLIGKLFAGAIIFSFLGYMTPELREQIPSFYKVIDLLLYGLEWFYSQLPL